MAKDKTSKKSGVKAQAAATTPLNGVKAGRVTKPADHPKIKSKDNAKAAAKVVEKKHKRKDSLKESASEDDATSDSSESSGSDSESEVEAKTKKSAPKVNGSAKAVKAADLSDSESSEDDSESEAESKKPVAKANGVKKTGDIESSDPSDIDVPAVAAAGKAPAAKDDDSDDSSEDDSEDSESDEEEKPATKTKGVKLDVKKEAKDDDSSSDDESDEDVQMKDENSSDASDSSSDDDEEEEAKPVKKEVKTESKKRKAEEAPSTPMKRFKANGEPVGEPSKNLFVGSLSWNVDEEWLAREFDGFGEVAGVRIITDPNSGRSKGYGYVEFTSIEDATKALDAKQGAELDGREINVDFGKPRPDRSYNSDQVKDRAQKFGDRQPNEPSSTLFVGNISFNATQDVISETFQEYGTVNGVRLPTDPETGVMKGFGYVEFGSIDEAQAAMEALNGADIAGRNIRLDFAGARSNSGGGFGGSPRGGRGRGGFNDRGGRGGFGGRGGRGGFGDRGRGGRGGGRGGGARGGRGGSFNRGGFGDFQGKKVTF